MPKKKHKIKQFPIDILYDSTALIIKPEVFFKRTQCTTPSFLPNALPWLTGGTPHEAVRWYSSGYSFF